MSRMRNFTGLRRQGISLHVVCCLLCTTLFAQTTSPNNAAPIANSQQLSDIESRLNDLTQTLTQTQQALQQSLLEIQRLRAELDALRAQNNPTPHMTPSIVLPAPAVAASGNAVPQTDTSVQDELEALQEQQNILQAEIQQHEQTKVETNSKYGLRVTGLILFNAFSNTGVVDDAELPTFALQRLAGTSHGSVGATLRQTILGLAATGPVISGAQTTATLNMDFFGGTTTNTYGYSAPSGVVRLRDTEVRLAWDKTTLKLGYTGPLISPLSPTSYATVAQPGLSGSGNLWTWSPQISVKQAVPLSGERGLSLEAGLIVPASSYYSSLQLDSPSEASRRPGVEGRVSYQADRRPTASQHSLVFGVGTYSASQYYSNNIHIHSWAVTGDWQIPLSHWIDLSGEIYRGRSLGGLGGGLYKDALMGNDPVTGLSRTVGVDAAGGWSQLKFNATRRIEANAMFGLDEAFSSSYDAVVLPASSPWITLADRNRSLVGNLIFRPRLSLIFSPEYRRILSWSYTGAPSVANIFTISAGYQF